MAYDLMFLCLQRTYTVDTNAKILINGKFVRILMAESGVNQKTLYFIVSETVAETV
jgi:hypothetical protein